MLRMVLRAMLGLLPMQANRAVAVEAAKVLRSRLKDFRHRHVFPTLFVLPVGLVEFPLLAADHEVTRH
jgi:hypothetical protein